MPPDGDLITGHDELLLVHPRSIDQYTVGAAQVLDCDLPVVHHETSVASRDERIVQDQLAAVAAPDDGHSPRQLEIPLVLKTQPDAAPQPLGPDHRRC